MYRHFICQGALVAFGVASLSLASAASNSVRVWKEGGYRYIESNGIPDHETGQFPNPGNPNKISSQDYTFRMPLSPRLGSRATTNGHNLFGVALNGVPFDPATAEYWNNDRHSSWNYEALSGKINLGLDPHHAHVQPNGAYHYHGVPTGFLKANASPELVGYAADGFPIYYDSRAQSSYRLKKGTRASGPGGLHDGTFVEDYEYVEGAGDLDECNGKTGATPEHPEGSYHYYLTASFPFVPRCLKGEPDSSFQKKRSPEAEPPGRGGRPRPPSEAIEACSGKRSGDGCHFDAPHGTVSGSCEDIEGFVACVPAGHHRG